MDRFEEWVAEIRSGKFGASKPFEEWVRMLRTQWRPGEWFPVEAMGGIVLALEALAAERAEERDRMTGKAPPLCDPPLSSEQVADWHKMAPGQVIFLAPGQVLLSGSASKRTTMNGALAAWRDEGSAYTRAMTAPRMGGQHPHDGRHIMSMRHWGMH